MFINLPIITDLLTIHQARQQKIDQRLVYANAQRHPHDFKVNDTVFCLTDRSASNKLKPVYTGPHIIETIHPNGTVCIRLGPNIRDRVNIRHLKIARTPPWVALKLGRVKCPPGLQHWSCLRHLYDLLETSSDILSDIFRTHLPAHLWSYQVV